MKRSPLFLSLAFALVSGALAVKPTDVRLWISKTGTRITGKASELTPNGSVQLVTKDGRELTVGIDEFSEADQDFLEKHFRTNGKKALPQAQPGTHRGPLDADADTSYYVYVPKDFDDSYRAPVMIWTQSDGATAGTLERFDEAADLLGMVIATPVEARNEGAVTLLNNSTHTRDVLKELRSEFPLNMRAIHFGGVDSGATAAFQNSRTIRSAGTFTVSGFFTPDMTGVNNGHHFLAGSTNSENRYLTAWAATKFGENGTHYLYEGSREMPEERDVTIGMVWMYAQGLYDDLAARGKEARSFEKRVLPYLEKLAETSPGDAAYLTKMLTEECKLRSEFKQKVTLLHQKLGKSEEAVDHVKGREALDDFSEKEMTRYGNHFSPLKEHAPKKFERSTENLAKKYPKAEKLQSIFEQLAKPTHR